MKYRNTDEMISEMKNNNVDVIISGATSSSPLLNLNAVLYGTKFKIKSKEFTSALKDNLVHSNEKFFGMPLSEIVIAALDVLGVEKYSGTDKLILRLISSEFADIV